MRLHPVYKPFCLVRQKEKLQIMVGRPVQNQILSDSFFYLGDSFVTFSFETGKPEYKELQNGIFVAAGHFVKEPGQDLLIVEYKVSKVII